jgi:hypothetical protein
MELEQLKQVLYTTDLATILVAPRVLRRLLQAEYHVPYLLVQAPHERCYFFDREVLFRHVEQDELEIESDRLLPSTVILLARPSAELLATMANADILLRYWRLLFHVHVHLVLHQKLRDGSLTAEVVRNRIDRIGQAAFDEIRAVLDQEKDLLPPADDVHTYMEFAAVYLELRYFRSNLRASYFPALSDFQAIDQLLAQDVDADALFARTRLEGAPDPVVHTDTSSDESYDYFNKLCRNAQRARDEGDDVRAGILHTKAARVAPVPRMQPTRDEALRDMERLTEGMMEALKFSQDEEQEWQRVLPALLDKSDQGGNWPVEAKLLYDLQEVSMEHRRRTFALDVIEWILTGGKRPMKRPLSSLQLVRMTKHLRRAAQRLTLARVSDEDRQRFARLLQSAEQLAETRMRERFRPILRDAIHDVGLVATNPPEVVAQQKIVEELLDHILEYGYFTFSDLRDTLSRNQLKLADLTDPYTYWRGDPLRQLDRRLAVLLEGVYRPGEFYLRWLESCSSLFFGTGIGRVLTRNLIAPFTGAFLILMTVEITINHYRHVSNRPVTTGAVATALATGGLSAATAGTPGVAAVPLATAYHSAGGPAAVRLDSPTIFPWWTHVILGVFLLLLIRMPELRHFFAEIGRMLSRGTRLVFYEVPLWVWNQPLVQQALASWPVLLLYWYVLKPLVICLAVWLNWPSTWESRPMAISMFLFLSWYLNSPYSYALSEAAVEMVVLLYSWLRFDLFQGLVRWISRFFKQVTNTVELVLYTVDEWLRFRGDESRVTMGVRAVLGVIWFPIGYCVRFYFLTLLEPTLNPIKLPFSSLAFKLMMFIPLYRDLMLNPGMVEDWLTQYMAWHLAVVLAFAFILPTLWLLPGVFAFFTWEMQANWRLFRANRSNRLRTLAVGRHGETLLQLLKPGFHSGTIPLLYSNLRHAEASAYLTNDWRPARTYRQHLREVAMAVKVFIEREFIALVRQSHTWPNQPVSVAQILLSCNRIRIELRHGDHPQEPLWLVFEQHGGWLIGSLQETGWLKYLTPEQGQVLNTALAGLYKIGGVDFVREQVAAVLPPQLPGYDFSYGRLVTWTGLRNNHEIAYDLRDRREQLRPRQLNGKPVAHMPVLEARRLFFSRVPLTWEQWVESWEKDRQGKGHPRLFSEGGPLALL